MSSNLTQLRAEAQAILAQYSLASLTTAFTDKDIEFLVRQHILPLKLTSLNEAKTALAQYPQTAMFILMISTAHQEQLWQAVHSYSESLQSKSEQ